jgi:hypothetical protein
MQNAKCKMQNAKCKMQNAKCKMQNAARAATPLVTPTGAQRSGGVFPCIKTEDSSLRSE